jgi:hypothetical protein
MKIEEVMKTITGITTYISVSESTLPELNIFVFTVTRMLLFISLTTSMGENYSTL